MKNIFIFTAGNLSAQEHMKSTIENPIPAEKVERFFIGDLEKIREIGKKYGYYAWGATPGPGNIRNWNDMHQGDFILIVQGGKYIFLSKALYKAQNREFAIENWGEENGKTWEYIYFLEKPIRIEPPKPLVEVSQYLNERYFGFIKIANYKIDKIIQNYKSLENFFSRELNVSLDKKRTFPFFRWVNKGKSFASDIPQNFLWAPKASRDGTTPFHWENMRNLKIGDIIFHYAKGALRGISIVERESYDSTYEYEQNSEWLSEGRRADVDYYPLDPILAKDQINSQRARLQDELKNVKGPFDQNGDIKQGYLFNFNFNAAKIIRQVYGRPFPEPIEKYFPTIPGPNIETHSSATNLLLKKKQIILYGPPGTGKTYQTKNIAMELIKQRVDDRL